MKMKKILLITMALVFSASSSSNTIEKAIQQNPLSDENKLVAKLGLEIASKTMSYAKSVRRVNGKTIVDVVVANKLCHVTFNQEGKSLVADKIACDGGNYSNRP